MVVNKELGLCADVPLWANDRFCHLLVTDEPETGTHKTLAALVVTERPARARLMPQAQEFSGEFLGIERFWVQKRFRTLDCTLLDRVRLWAGPNVKKSRVAFGEAVDSSTAIKYLATARNLPCYVVY